MFYLYIKSFHLIFLIAWMVSLLYLPRLFVYHSTLSKSNPSYNLFLLMEIRLIKIIAIPAMLLTFLLGTILIYHQIDLINESYFIIKLMLVGFLAIYQLYLIYLYLILEKENKRSAVFYRYINEAPTILMIIIILLVVLKPNIG